MKTKIICITQNRLLGVWGGSVTMIFFFTLLMVFNSSADVIACGPEDTIHQPPANGHLESLVGHWHPGELLGMNCATTNESYIGFRTTVNSNTTTDFMIPVSYDLCVRILTNQNRATLQELPNIFSTQIYVSPDQELIAIQSIARPKRRLLVEPSLSPEMRGALHRSFRSPH